MVESSMIGQEVVELLLLSMVTGQQSGVDRILFSL
jgi:hypothetical protein